MAALLYCVKSWCFILFYFILTPKVAVHLIKPNMNFLIYFCHIVIKENSESHLNNWNSDAFFL